MSFYTNKTYQHLKVEHLMHTGQEKMREEEEKEKQNTINTRHPQDQKKKDKYNKWCPRTSQKAEK